ncbi:hypothetical protein WA556_000712 [Blastocystis sp. ATCC 50177/Nand II]
MDYDVEYLGNKMSSLLHLRDFYLPSISLQIGNISLPIFDVNATELIQCVTMDGRCTLLDSMYDQYVKIMQDYNASCLAIQSQYQAVKQSVANYQLAVAGVLAEVQYLYYRIEQVSDLLKHIGVDLGELPSLALPSLSLPPLAIDWQMPPPEDIYAKLAVHLSAVSAHLASVANASQARAQHAIEAIASVASSFDGWFEDYQPPTINTTRLLLQFEANQAEFTAAVWETVTNTSASIATL